MQKPTTIEEYVMILLPMISGSIVSMNCFVGDRAGKNVNARPPPQVFGIVWFILYMLIGISWFKNSKNTDLNKIYVNALYLSLIFLLCLWVYLYGCNKHSKNAMFTLPVSMIITIFIIMYCKEYFLVPLLVWLLFALLLNVSEVNDTK